MLFLFARSKGALFAIAVTLPTRPSAKPSPVAITTVLDVMSKNFFATFNAVSYLSSPEILSTLLIVSSSALTLSETTSLPPTT